MLVDFLDDGVRLNQLTVAVIVEAVLRLQVCNFFVPRIQRLFKVDAVPIVQQVGHVFGQHAHVMPADAFDLADLGDIHVEVGDIASIGREVAGVAGDAVVEATADGDQEVTVFDRVVCGSKPVHA